MQVARAGFMMIHNVWVVAMGNRNDLRDAADQLETFDDALASIYSARTGKDKKEIAKLMDRETWFSGDQAIEDGFADALLPADQVEQKEETDEGAQAGVRMVDTVLAKAGISRSQRRALINRIKESGNGKPSPTVGTHDAAHVAATHDAGVVAAVAGSLTEFFKGKAAS